MRIFLIGFMGSGKTSNGKRLAKMLGLDFYDTDILFEEKYHISVKDFFYKYDEDLFRKLEREILRESFSYNNALISTGGGTPCFFDNMKKINQHGLSVYLKLDPKSLAHRLYHSKKKRPLIPKDDMDYCSDFVNKTLQKREVFYLQSHLIIQGENLKIKNTAQNILAALEH
jgi:shikimate kinase